MNFNFIPTEEIGSVRSRANRIFISNDTISYDLENRVVMNNSIELYDIGSLIAPLKIDKDIDSVDRNTGEVLGTKNLLALSTSMKTKANKLVSRYSSHDLIPTTEVGSSYFEIKNIEIINTFNTAPVFTFKLNEVLILSRTVKRIEKDSVVVSMVMNILDTDTVKTTLELYQDIFDIMVDRALDLTEEDLSWLLV